MPTGSFYVTENLDNAQERPTGPTSSFYSGTEPYAEVTTIAATLSDVTAKQVAADAAASAAATHETNALSYANAAFNYQQSASTSATAASNSASAAGVSASDAATDATNAAASEVASASSATSAASSQSAAAASATNAGTSATAAAASQSAAATSETNAATSETNALSYANAAFNYQNAASISSTAASTSATNAASSATAAAGSASAAGTSATSAASSATAASGSASAANTSATNAASSATAASGSASAALTSATNAASSASAASASATLAANIASVYDTLVDAANTHIANTTTYVLTNGYSAVNDGGGFIYRRNDATTSNFSWSDLNGHKYEPIFSREISTDAMGAIGNGTTDDWGVLQNGLIEFSRVVFCPRTYKITNKLTLKASQTVKLHSGTTVRQYGTEKQIFSAWSVTAVWIEGNGALLYGLGSDWNGGGTWTGLDHPAIAVEFQNCTGCGVRNLRIINCAEAGIALTGGCLDITVTNIHIEGTHAWGTPLPFNTGNFQVGIYIRDDSTTPYTGLSNNIKISNVEISGTCHGVLVEDHNAALDTPRRNITIIGIIIHDIPSQHGFYIQAGGLTVKGARLYNIALDAVKLQSPATPNPETRIANVDIDFVATFVGGNGFVANSLGTTSLVENVTVKGIIESCATGGMLNADTGSGTIKNVKLDLRVLTASSNAFAIQTLTGGTPTIQDCDIDLYAQAVSGHGININCATGTIKGIRIKAKIRQADASGSSNSAVFVNVPSTGDVTFFDLDTADSGTHNYYGLYVFSGNVYVRGSVKLKNVVDAAVRVDNPAFIQEWPSSADLDKGASGYYIGLSRIRSSSELVIRQTTNSSTATLWVMEMDDNTDVSAVIEVVTYADDHSVRKMVQSRCVAHRAGAGAIIDGFTNYVSGTDLPSGAWASGASLSWGQSANTISVSGTSTGAYHWTVSVRATVTP